MTGKKFTFILVALVSVALLLGCSKRSKTAEVTNPGEEAKVLTIAWQHSPEKEGTKCEKCLAKKAEIQKAYESLKNSLPSLGIQVALTEEPVKTMSCGMVLSQSSKICIGGRMLEEWLGAELGPGTCGKGCTRAPGEAQCVSLKLEGETYEVVPADLIVKAGLVAASDMLGPKSSKPCPKGGTCPKQTAGGCGH